MWPGRMGYRQDALSMQPDRASDARAAPNPPRPRPEPAGTDDPLEAICEATGVCRVGASAYISLRSMGGGASKSESSRARASRSASAMVARGSRVAITAPASEWSRSTDKDGYPGVGGQHRALSGRMSPPVARVGSQVSGSDPPQLYYAITCHGHPLPLGRGDRRNAR